MMREGYFHIIYSERYDSNDILFRNELNRVFFLKTYQESIFYNHGRNINGASGKRDSHIDSKNVIVGTIIKEKVIRELKKDIVELAEYYGFKYEYLESMPEEEYFSNEDYNNTVFLIIKSDK